MKKFLCLLFCILGCLFTVLFGVLFVTNYAEHNIPKLVSVLTTISSVIVFVSLIIGFAVIDVSVDQWFPDADATSGMMSIKDRILLVAAMLITLGCMGIFILTILYNNINAIRTTETDNMFLRMLLLITANTIMAFAYYQHFKVLKMRES